MPWTYPDLPGRVTNLFSHIMPMQHHILGMTAKQFCTRPNTETSVFGLVILCSIKNYYF